MGQALQAVRPSLISCILQCVKNTDIPLPNQKAAIRAFRWMDITDEVHCITYSAIQLYNCDGTNKMLRISCLMFNLI